MGGEARRGAPLVCRLPLNDPWMQNILRPIVEAAGYDVIADGDDRAADLTIVGDSNGVAAPTGEGGRRLRLATDPSAADGIDSIYRYDRAGLLMALKSTGTGR